MSPPSDTDPIVVIGAGMSGLSAATALTRAGRHVVVLDKGRGPGGRLANRRFGGATFDHGAQFFTARDPEFIKMTRAWEEQGLVKEWYRAHGEARYGARPAINAIAKDLGKALEIRSSTRVEAVQPAPSGWRVAVADAPPLTASAIILTAPVPQALELIHAGGIVLEDTQQAELESIHYERCFAVMATLDGPSGLAAPGTLTPERGPIAWIADNQTKGISGVSAVTIHATPSFSMDHWDTDRDETARLLLQAAGGLISAPVKDYQIHGWKFSRPIGTRSIPCMCLHASPPLLIAGDGFGGGRIEGAVRSGWAAAAHLLSPPPR